MSLVDTVRAITENRIKNSLVEHAGEDLREPDRRQKVKRATLVVSLIMIVVFTELPKYFAAVV